MRILGIVSYDGSAYFGWQIQNDALTIEEEIEKVLSKILNTETKIYGSGRTDAGVHASGQTFHFDTDKIVDLGKLKYSCNQMLPDDIKIISFIEVSSDFHARFSIKSKEYEYLVNDGEYDVFSRKYSYQLMQKLDVEKMIEASKFFIGKHNFQNFTSKEEDEDNFVREIFDIKIKRKLNTISLIFVGNGFMRYMVRNIAGSLIQVGLNKISPNNIEILLNKEPRNIVGYKAPAHGLYLRKVNY